MNFAVVKFLEETNASGEEIISEVPSSWLTKDNKFCKWPPEKFVGVYINKCYPPQDDWKEYSVLVEDFCATLKEAKEMASGEKSQKTCNKVGRGFRTIKPTDYFSPAEEEDRMKALQSKKLVPGNDESSNGFMKCILNGEESEKNQDSCEQFSKEKDENEEIDVSEKNTATQNNPNEVAVMDIYKTSDNNKESDAISGAGSGEVSMVTGTVISDSGIEKLEQILNSAVSYICDIKLDIAEIKQRLDDLGSVSTPASKPTVLPSELPLKSLEDLETLENYVKSDAEGSNNFVKHIKVIGGNDAKDFTLRVLKKVLTNSLAEVCSWTGRKGNYMICNLKLVNLIFETVHHKYRHSNKEFELTIMEWLRHAKQRRIRENINN